jgi:hypothetical protein
VYVKGMLSLSAVLVAAIGLVSASGAGTASTRSANRIDVSTRVSIVHYLRTIHVNPKGLVIQRGARNYAGPKCPGRGWTCTSTTHPVVQVARAGGKNAFACSTARCAVVQVATAGARPNKGVCIKTTGLTQSCTINQSGPGPNTAGVYENAGNQGGLTQTASYTATITQLATDTSAAGSNTACVTQAISLTGSTVARRGAPVTVTLEAHQSVTIAQNVLGMGANSAQFAADSSGNCTVQPLAQTQTLTSIANGTASITQNENDATVMCPDGTGLDSANMCLDIEQNQGDGSKGVASGTNNATFTQTNSLTAIANSPAGPISQTQSSPNGGLLGTVNQDSTGVSTANVTQTETQCEDAARSGLTSCDTDDPDAIDAPSPLTQIQHGPVKKGLGTATQTGGNNGDTLIISQSSNQDNDQGTGSAQTNVIQGDCSTSGNCTDTQNTNINGTPTTNTQSGSNVNASTNCTGSTCTTCTGSNCTTSLPSGDVFVSVGDGHVQEWNPANLTAPVRTLDTGKGLGALTAGLGFDLRRTLYSADFSSQDVSHFNGDGTLLGSFGSGYNQDPESIVFDSSGNAYVGQADGTQDVLKFSPSGTPLTSFDPAIDDRGTDWIDLASGGCTLYYTSEGTLVKRFDVCTNTQLSDFATLPGSAAYTVRLLPGGGALVADTGSIVRLNSFGNVAQQYGTGGTAWFSLALDPSGTAFWAGDVNTGDVKKFDLSTGNVLASFNTGGPVGDAAGGLAVAP